MFQFRRDEKIAILKKVPLFSDLSKRQLIELSKHSDKVEIDGGHVITKEGVKGNDFFLIIEGKAQVKKGRKIIRNLKSGDYFGEISLIDGEPRTASVIAETDINLLFVNHKSFEHLLKTVPGLQEKIMVSLCTYLRRAEKANII